MFQHKGLSASLASRLSRGENSFNKTKIKQADNFPPNNALHGRLGRPIPSLRMKSVYSRLTGTSNKRILQIQSNAFLKSIEAIGSEVKNKSRRPIKSLKTKSNSDEFLPVRINNGALVKGLRSDQLLLQKVKEQKSIALEYKRDRHKMLREMERRLPEKVDLLMRSSRVSMDLNTGLTISFANNDTVKKNRLLKGKPSYSGQSDEMSVNSSEDEYPVRKHQRPSFRNDLAEEVKVPLLRIGMERPPPPKPHRQILDTKVQKEIAALQGRLESPHSGPGPGVKNFRMIPNLTKFSLSERFTIERTVIE